MWHTSLLVSVLIICYLGFKQKHRVERIASGSAHTLPGSLGVRHWILQPNVAHIVHCASVLDEAQETRRAALARQDEADGERLSFEERVELAEDVLIVCFHTVAPPDR